MMTFILAYLTLGFACDSIYIASLKFNWEVIWQEVTPKQTTTGQMFAILTIPFTWFSYVLIIASHPLNDLLLKLLVKLDT